MSDDHRPPGPTAAGWQRILRRIAEVALDTTVEEQRLRALKAFWQRHPELATEWRVSEAELAAHRFIGMDDFVLLKTRSRFAQTVRLLQTWTDGDIGRSRVLDIGASDGLLLKLLGRPGVGLDTGSYWAKRMRAKGLVGLQATAERLPFRDKAFDYVTCFECLEHVENPIATLKEIERVCRKGLFLSIPWVAKTRIRQDNYDSTHTDAEGHHIFEFNDRDFRKIVSHTGFRVRQHHPLHVYAMPAFGMAYAIRRRLELHLPNWAVYGLFLEGAGA